MSNLHGAKENPELIETLWISMCRDYLNLKTQYELETGKAAPPPTAGINEGQIKLMEWHDKERRANFR